MVTRVFVNKDWGSTGIWLQDESGHWCNAPHNSVDMPPGLRDRFEFWCEWYDHYMPGMREDDVPDDESIEAYKIGLAVDLKRHLASAAQVYVYSDGRHKEILLPLLEAPTRAL